MSRLIEYQDQSNRFTIPSTLPRHQSDLTYSDFLARERRDIFDRVGSLHERLTQIEEDICQFQRNVGGQGRGW